ncbi:MAG: hypothetical protein Q4E01_07495 [Actinomycetaceae bacterium]|nr:hypothetical protein [Actinomycetaceae bacterium]
MERKKGLLVGALVALIVAAGLVVGLLIKGSAPTATPADSGGAEPSVTENTDPSASERKTEKSANSETSETGREAEGVPESYAPVADSKLPDTDKALDSLSELPQEPEKLIEPEVADQFGVKIEDVFTDGTTLKPYPQTWTDIDDRSAMVVVQIVMPGEEPEYYSALLELVDGEWKLLATLDYDGDIPE